MSAAFTPGPWSYDYAPVSSGDTAEFMILTADRAVVAHVWPDAEKGVTGGTVEANARLISAAPELLKTLKGAIKHIREITLYPREIKLYPRDDKDAPALVAAEALIAKAEGREP